MSRYIDYDDAIERLGTYLMADAQIEWGGTASEDIEDWKELATDILKGSPSIDIVRCKECEYWNTKDCREGVGECEWAYYMTKPDDFCSYGERREP